MVNLNQIELATAEDKRYAINYWAQLFKATTWEAIKMLAAKNEYLAEASETMFQSYHDACVRTHYEALEEGRLRRRGLEIKLERAEEKLALKENELQTSKETIQQQEAEILRLKELLSARDS